MLWGGHVLPRRTTLAFIVFVNVLSSTASGSFKCADPVVRGSACTGRVAGDMATCVLLGTFGVTMFGVTHVRVVGTSFTDETSSSVVIDISEVNVALRPLRPVRICPFSAESSIRSGKEKDEGEESWFNSRRFFVTPSHLAGRTNYSEQRDPGYGSNRRMRKIQR